MIETLNFSTLADVCSAMKFQKSVQFMARCVYGILREFEEEQGVATPYWNDTSGIVKSRFYELTRFVMDRIEGDRERLTLREFHDQAVDLFERKGIWLFGENPLSNYEDISVMQKVKYILFIKTIHIFVEEYHADLFVSTPQ